MSLRQFLFVLHRQLSSSSFIPPHHPVADSEISALVDFLSASNRTLVLTGAGVSTESGIPDYRSQGIGLYSRSSHRPIQYRDFLQSADIRKRYWARNFVGWPQFSTTEPNQIHHILSKWEQKGLLFWLVTQNVDNLHRKAGSKKLTELHGCAHFVFCLNCNHSMDRQLYQSLITNLNPDFHPELLELNPDGDVTLSDEYVEMFQVPKCPKCGEGPIQPEVTFFGGSVAKKKVDFVTKKVKECERLLILGSSIQVYSAFRVANQAHASNKPTAIVNIGPTRADSLSKLIIKGLCSEVLLKVDDTLSRT